MKTVVKTVCLTLLLSALVIPTSVWSESASASAAILHVTVAQAADDQPLRFNHISTKQGLSSFEVWSVLRDRRGFTWFGTLDELHRYDGYKMKIFRHALFDPTSLSENTIRTLYQNRTGVLWFGTWTGGPERFDPQAQTFTHYQPEC